MFRTGTSRRLIALVAAYGLALQAMLSVVVAAAPTFEQTICATNGPHDGADPKMPSAPGHEPGCPLCPLACDGAFAPPRLDAAITPTPGFDTVVAPSAAAAAPLPPVVRRAGLARAPPV